MTESAQNQAAAGKSEFPPRTIAAIIEVLLAFAAMHLAFRSFMTFTALGRMEVGAETNFSPGIAMIVVALAFIAIWRKKLVDYGLSARPLLSGVNAGLTAFLVLVVIGALLLVLGFRYEPESIGPGGAMLFASAQILAACVGLWILARIGTKFRCARSAVSVFVMVVLLVLPIAAAEMGQHSLGREVLAVMWIVIGAAIGEEVFFRGYVQSRLNEAFGRPFRAFGVHLGFGLLGSSLLFGLVHALNTTDYFTGNCRLLWWHGLTTGATLYYGFLREKTGTIVAPVVLHASINLLARIARQLT